jgi:hypothetical protein
MSSGREWVVSTFKVQPSELGSKVADILHNNFGLHHLCAEDLERVKWADERYMELKTYRGFARNLSTFDDSNLVGLVCRCAHLRVRLEITPCLIQWKLTWEKPEVILGKLREMSAEGEVPALTNKLAIYDPGLETPRQFLSFLRQSYRDGYSMPENAKNLIFEHDELAYAQDVWDAVYELGAIDDPDDVLGTPGYLFSFSHGGPSMVDFHVRCVAKEFPT